MSKRQPRNDLSAEFVRSLLDYDPMTGDFTWRQDMSSTAKRGQRAGAKHGDGYIEIMIRGRHYLAHRLAWLVSHGCWPEHTIDHIDRNRTNNALSNIRCASNAENQRNSSTRRGAPIKGYCRNAGTGKYYVQLRLNGRAINLGVGFDTPEEATAAYWRAKAEHHGEFCPLREDTP